TVDTLSSVSTTVSLAMPHVGLALVWAISNVAEPNALSVIFGCRTEELLIVAETPPICDHASIPPALADEPEIANRCEAVSSHAWRSGPAATVAIWSSVSTTVSRAVPQPLLVTAISHVDE